MYGLEFLLEKTESAVSDNSDTFSLTFVIIFVSVMVCETKIPQKLK